MATTPKVLEEPASAAVITSSVFQPGKLAVEVISVEHDARPTPPPIPILIAAPKDAGTYPVAIILHGFFLQNRYYEQLLKHVASFGFIMVAPQVLVGYGYGYGWQIRLISSNKQGVWLHVSIPLLTVCMI